MVHIIGDTTSVLDPAFVAAHDVPVIPQVIHIDGETYLEGEEIDSPTFMEKMESAKELPKTSAPPPELFVELFERLAPTGEPMICILPSSAVSGTVRSATVAKREFPDADIRIIDTGFIAGPVRSMIEVAVSWAESGVDADTIEQRVYEMMPRSRLYFVVDTLKYLAMGGRIGGAAALMGSILKVRPVLMFDNSRVDVFEKVRTKRRALNRMKELVYEQIARERDGHLTVLHAGVPDEGQALADELAEQLGYSDVPVLDMPPAIVTHGGPGILGVGFFTD